jgi:protein gp37
MTAIQWTNSTANFFTGCSLRSSACVPCYAVPLSFRLAGMGQEAYSGVVSVTEKGKRYFNGNINPNFEAALNVITCKRAKKIFVSSMTDFWHENVPLEYHKKALQMMNEYDHHTYQILSKRPENIQRVLNETGVPLPKNTWLGVTVEGDVIDVVKKQNVKYRIDHIRNINQALVRFLSVEPLIGPLKFDDSDLVNVNWIIIGGESGHHARPFHLEWCRDIILNIDDIAQRLDQKIAIFVKQPGRDNFINGVKVHVEKWDKQAAAPDSWPRWMRRREMPITLPTADLNLLHAKGGSGKSHLDLNLSV